MENNMLNILKYYLGTGLMMMETEAEFGEPSKYELVSSNMVNAAKYDKPCLRPLAGLIPELAEWWNNKFDETGDAAKHYLEAVIKDNPIYMPYHLAEKVFELHGDLFNLLDQGLAVKEGEK
jgi:hypothetical protein